MNTNLMIDVRKGNVGQLFWKRYGRVPFKVDALVGFLPTHGKWFSALDILMKQSVSENHDSSGDGLQFGRTTDGGFITYFHKKVGTMAGAALNHQIGGAVYVKHDENELDALDTAFFDVVWGIVEEPSHIRLALTKAIILAARQKALQTTLVLPWYGTKDTTLPDTELTQYEKLLVAQAWTLGQVQGLRAAAVQLEHPVKIIILLPEKEELVDWMVEFKAAVDVVSLSDVATITYEAS
jgi:hypothetical protein